MYELSLVPFTENDHRRLTALVGASRRGRNGAQAASLAGRLAESVVMSDESIPGSVATMNSELALTELGSGRTYRYRLVYPGEANILLGRISVLTPLGSALVGLSEGDEFEYESPGGPVRMRLDRILWQPEANSVFDL